MNSLLVAVVTATSIHRLMEPRGINLKLQRLAKAVSTGTIEKLPIKGIDTRAKAYIAGLIPLVMFSAASYPLATIVDPTIKVAIIYSVVVLIVSDVITMIAIDKYHADIEVLTKKLKKN